jgi:phosphohistidine phosphatase SixA
MRDERAELAEDDGQIRADAMVNRGRRRALSVFSLSFAVAVAGISLGPAHAQMMPGSPLMDGLRKGGYVLVMRHANSPAMPPAKAQADPENVKLERQLDQMGRDTAKAMGESFKRLRIPVGEVISSPTYRARLTAQLAFGVAPKTAPELDEGVEGMASNADVARVAWLRKAIGERPAAGKNTVLITHAPNISGAFDVPAQSGEVLIFRPGGSNPGTPLARVKIQDWPTLK